MNFITIDFETATKELISLFDDMQNLDWFFLKLQQFTHVRLYEHDSVIIFDEVEYFSRARQVIKYLVADGRYKYLETGSYLERKKNLQNILIPGEELKLTLIPLDFEEFLQSLNSIFYHKKIVDRSIKISDVFKNRNHKVEELKVKVSFDSATCRL